MARIAGYDGGDREEQLLAALKQGVATESDDGWGRIPEKDMYIGSIVDICVSKGYVKASRLGFAGYFVTKVGYAETYIRQCWHVWQKRRDFDAVREWVTNSNTFTPSKLSGPLLFLDSHKAWLERRNPNARQKKTAKKPTIKELRHLVQAYRNMLDRLGGEHVKLAEDADREPRVWNQIVLERATIEAEFSEATGDTEFPVTATRHEDVDDEQGDAQEADDAVLSGERSEPQDSLPESKQYQGVDFTLVGEIQVPPRHPQRPQKPVLRLPHCVVREPDIVDHSIIIQPDTRPNPATIVLSPTAVAGDERDETEHRFQLPAKWAGRASAISDKRCRNLRAAFYKAWGQYLTLAQVEAALKLPKKMWLGAKTVADVLAQIDALTSA